MHFIRKHAANGFKFERGDEMENKAIVFIDSEVKKENNKITDLGAVNEAGEQFHSKNLFAFTQFLQGNTYVCGHNLVHHDLKYLEKSADLSNYIPIDTLYLSPLLFPEKPSKYEALYDTKVGKSTLKQVNREHALQRLMTINMLKRLESCVDSFRKTVRNIC